MGLARRAGALAWLLCLRLARPWQPQQEAQGRTPHDMIFLELKRSLSIYKQLSGVGEVSDFVRRIVGIPYMSVMILDNRLIVDRRMLHIKKGLHHVEFVKSIMERGPLPNIVYQFEANADGIQSDDQLFREGCPTPKAFPAASDVRVKPKSRIKQKVVEPLPKIVIAKRYGYDQCGLLMPNCYFDAIGKWDKLSKEIIAATKRIKFEDRDSRVFWRGTIREQSDCADDTGNFARLQAVSLSAAHPDTFDVKCTSCQPRDEKKRACAALPYDADMRRAMGRGNRSAISGEHVDKTTFGNYRYQLNLPGSVSGSYSRNLNHLWMLGSAVVLWDAPYVEWYYPALKDGVTHVTVNKSDAFSVVRGLSEARTLKLAAEAARVHREFLSAGALAAYWRELVRQYRDHFGLAAVVDSPAFLETALRPALNMSEMQFVEFRQEAGKTKFALINKRSAASCTRCSPARRATRISRASIS
ncbi:hypothetical protein M885DRAFT_76304 [Pelagophyceae sp. CCMP2097]|nr:hypothetical protein M885DRAFT_76304 [Pelagophyceae sp. CCMP2097]